MGKFLIIPVLSLLIFQSCGIGNGDEQNLTESDLKYINRIIPLEEDENIQMFETNGGFNGLKTSGNFITNKRLASYWIDGRNNEVNSIKYNQVDSIIIIDKTSALTYASYIQVFGMNTDFNIYVDADSTRTW